MSTTCPEKAITAVATGADISEQLVDRASEFDDVATEIATFWETYQEHGAEADETVAALTDAHGAVIEAVIETPGTPGNPA